MEKLPVASVAYMSFDEFKDGPVKHDPVLSKLTLTLIMQIYKGLKDGKIYIVNIENYQLKCVFSNLETFCMFIDNEKTIKNLAMFRPALLLYKEDCIRSPNKNILVECVDVPEFNRVYKSIKDEILNSTLPSDLKARLLFDIKL